MIPEINCLPPGMAAAARSFVHFRIPQRRKSPNAWRF
jgi:hypothetical protein